MVKKIRLTQGYYALVDAADYALVSPFKWTFQAAGGDTVGYAYRQAGGVKIYMHRVLSGAKPGELTDHIDRNGLNNCRSNLRIVPRTVNNENKRGYGRSRFKGVVATKNPRNRWQARIVVAGKSKHLGVFRTQTAAAKAYDDAVQQYRPDGVLNFEQDGTASA